MLLWAIDHRSTKRLRTYKRLRNSGIAVSVFSMAALWWLIVNAPVEGWITRPLGAIAFCGLLLLVLAFMQRVSFIHDDIRTGSIVKLKWREK